METIVEQSGIPHTHHFKNVGLLVFSILRRCLRLIGSVLFAHAVEKVVYDLADFVELQDAHFSGG